MRYIKNRFVITISILMAMAIGVCAFLFVIDKKPFVDLEPSEVVSASVLLLPPNERAAIDSIDTLVGLLNDIELTSRTIGHKVSGGQSCIFTIVKTDGTTQEMNVFGSYVIINGIGYQAVYEPCEAVNQYANSLLKQ